MKKLILLLLIIICFHSCSEKKRSTEELYSDKEYIANTEEQGILLLNKFLNNHSFEGLNAITNPLEKSPSHILLDYKQPSLSLIPKQKDGEFGIIKKDRFNIYYMQLSDSKIPKDTIVLIFEETVCCGYKISKFSKLNQ